MQDSRPTLAVVADDDEFFRMALVTLLTRRLGFADVIETASLDEALERLGDCASIGLALFDLSMPGMESPANLSAVRECAPGVKVAVVSTSTDRHLILASLEAGVHGYVPKQLGAAEIARALDLIMSGSIYVPALLAEIPSAAARTGQDGMPALDGSPHPTLSRAPVAAGATIGSLTARQREVLALLVEGKSNKEIGRALNLTEGTVKIHVAALLRALGVPNRSAAAVVGARMLDAERRA